MIIHDAFQQAFDLYQLGLQKWDKNTIKSVPGKKLFFFDNEDSLLGTFDCNEGIATDVAFTAAHKVKAATFVLMENHLDEEENIITKQELSLSQAEMVARFRETGETMGIPLKDYLLISPYGFYSAREHELIL